MIKKTKDCLYWTEMPRLIQRKTAKTHAVVQMGRRKVEYSKHNRIPAVGEQIHIGLNSIGTAVVKGYFIEHGFAGVLASPLNPPDWYKRQKAGKRIDLLRDCAGVFGAEFEFFDGSK